MILPFSDNSATAVSAAGASPRPTVPDSLILCDMSAEDAAGASPRPTCAYFILDYFWFPSNPFHVSNENTLCGGYAA